MSVFSQAKRGMFSGWNSTPGYGMPGGWIGWLLAEKANNIWISIASFVRRNFPDIKICPPSISREANKMYLKLRYHSECTNPCGTMTVSPTFLKRKHVHEHETALKLFFKKEIMVSRECLSYSGLSMFAEVAGYLGLTLGVSIMDITILIKIYRNRL